MLDPDDLGQISNHKDLKLQLTRSNLGDLPGHSKARVI
jgi:hypothetical protein